MLTKEETINILLTGLPELNTLQREAIARAIYFMTTDNLITGSNQNGYNPFVGIEDLEDQEDTYFFQ